MRYALNLAADGRILSATVESYGPVGAVLVAELPQGNIADYRFSEDGFVYDPLPVDAETPTQQDRLEAQLIYTAMMTDTLLEA